MAITVFLKIMSVYGVSFFLMRKGFFGNCKELKIINDELYIKRLINPGMFDFMFLSNDFSVNKGIFYDRIIYKDKSNDQIKYLPIFRPVSNNKLKVFEIN